MTVQNSFMRFLPALLVSLLIAGPLAAEDQTGDLRHLVQKPVAVSKLSAAGYPDRHIRTLAQTLNEAKVSPRSFNSIIRSVPYFAGKISSMEGVANYVALQHRRGLKRQELVESVRSEMSKQAFLWNGLFPANDEYLGDRARNILRRVRKAIGERRGREEGQPDLEPSSRQPPAPRRPGSPSPGQRPF